MSTKIYNGYYSNLGMIQLLKEFKTIAPTFKTLRAQDYVRDLVEKSVRKIDELTLKGETVDQYGVIDGIHSKERKEKNDLSNKIVCSLFPISSKRTLILYFDGNNREGLEMWDGLEFINDYHYQNQCDKPKDISTRNWNKRRKDWDKVLDWDKPIDVSFSFEFASGEAPLLYDKTKLIKEITDTHTLNNRARHQMKNKFIDDKMKELGFNETSKGFDLFFKAEDIWVKEKVTDDYAKKVSELETQLVPINFFDEKRRMIF